MLNLTNQTLLIIAPHPDDEVIGCAGLIQKIKQNGGKVFVLFLTVGNTKDFSKENFSSSDTRIKEIDEVSKFLQFDNYDISFIGDEYHLQLDKLGQKIIMDQIERESRVAIEKIKPTILVFPSPNSYNQDHKIAAMAAHASARPANRHDKHFIQTVLRYEAPADRWSMSDLQKPQLFIPLTKLELNNKLSSIELYKSQTREFPNLRSSKSLEILANLRGGEIGQEFAEGYFIDRISL